MRYALLMAGCTDSNSWLYPLVAKAVLTKQQPQRSTQQAYYTVDFDGKHYASSRCQEDMQRHNRGF